MATVTKTSKSTGSNGSYVQRYVIDVERKGVGPVPAYIDKVMKDDKFSHYEVSCPAYDYKSGKEDKLKDAKARLEKFAARIGVSTPDEYKAIKILESIKGTVKHRLQHMRDTADECAKTQKEIGEDIAKNPIQYMPWKGDDLLIAAHTKGLMNHMIAFFDTTLATVAEEQKGYLPDHEIVIGILNRGRAMLKTLEWIRKTAAYEAGEFSQYAYCMDNRNMQAEATKAHAYTRAAQRCLHVEESLKSKLKTFDDLITVIANPAKLARVNACLKNMEEANA